MFRTSYAGIKEELKENLISPLPESDVESDASFSSDDSSETTCSTPRRSSSDTSNASSSSHKSDIGYTPVRLVPSIDEISSDRLLKWFEKAQHAAFATQPDNYNACTVEAIPKHFAILQDPTAPNERKASVIRKWIGYFEEDLTGVRDWEALKAIKEIEPEKNKFDLEKFELLLDNITEKYRKAPPPPTATEEDFRRYHSISCGGRR